MAAGGLCLAGSNGRCNLLIINLAIGSAGVREPSRSLKDDFSNQLKLNAIIEI